MDKPASVSLPALPLPYCLGAGVTHYVPGEQHPARRGIGVYDLIVVKRGVLYLGEEQSIWEVKAGESVLLLPDAYHYPFRPCDTETTFYWLHFQIGQPAAGAGLTAPLQLSKYGGIPDAGRVYQLFEAMLQLAVEPRSSAFWREQELFLELLQLLDHSRAGKEETQTRRVAERVESFIKQHYREPLGSSQLSNELHFHYNYLTRCMKEVHGVTPSEYITLYRLDQAKRLLLTTEWSIARIAEHVGFQYPPYFSRCFVERFGMSPMKFRKQYAV